MRDESAQISISAIDLARAYAENWDTASRSYFGKVLEVTGTVRNAGRNSRGALFVNLEIDQPGPISCYFPDSEADKVAGLLEGRTLRLKGRNDSRNRDLFALILRDCVVITAGQLQPLPSQAEARTAFSPGHGALSQARQLTLQAELQKGRGEVHSEIFLQILAHIDTALRAGLAATAEAEARHIRGSAYEALERFDEAATEMTEALRLDPTLGNPFYLQSAWKTLSDIANRRGEPLRAIEYLEKALEGLQTLYNPSEQAVLIGETHCHLSLLYAIHQVELESAEQRALTHAQRALELAPEYPVTRFVLGSIYSARKPLNPSDRDMAMDYLETYLRMVGPTLGERTTENRWVNMARQFLASLRGETPRQERKQGCFVATAVYGNADHLDVRVLRQLRDEVLLLSSPGRAFVAFYYAISPFLVALTHAWGMKWLMNVPLVKPTLWMARSKLRGCSSDTTI